MMINKLCTIFVDMLFPDRTAIKRPAIDILITARRKATTAGMAGFASNMVPMRKGADDHVLSTFAVCFVLMVTPRADKVGSSYKIGQHPSAMPVIPFVKSFSG